MKYIKMFLTFLAPILGKAILQTAADELAKVAYPPTERRRYPAYNRMASRRPTSRVGRYDDLSLKDAFEQAAEDLDESPKFDISKAGFNDVLMVAFHVAGPNAAIVHEWLHNQMPQTGDRLARGENDETVAVNLDAWWVANDERFDGSDTDSAVFVTKGKQEAARALLRDAGLVD